MTKQAIPLSESQNIADHVIDLLRPVISRGVIAGSVRRGAEFCGDVEVVVEANVSPKAVSELVYGIAARDNVLTPRLNSMGHNLAYSGRFFATEYNGLPVDIWVVHPDRSWGGTLFIRTGSGDFNRVAVTESGDPVYKSETDRTVIGRGVCPRHLRFYNGGVVQMASVADRLRGVIDPACIPMHTPDENAIFELLRSPFIDPQDRTPERLMSAAGTITAPPLMPPTGAVQCYYYTHKQPSLSPVGEGQIISLTHKRLSETTPTAARLLMPPIQFTGATHTTDYMTPDKYKADLLNVYRWRYASNPQLWLDLLAAPVITISIDEQQDPRGIAVQAAIETLAKIAREYSIPFNSELFTAPPPTQLELFN